MPGSEVGRVSIKVLNQEGEGEDSGTRWALWFLLEAPLSIALLPALPAFCPVPCVQVCAQRDSWPPFLAATGPDPQCAQTAGEGGTVSGRRELPGLRSPT